MSETNLTKKMYIQEKLVGEYGDVVTFKSIDNITEAVLSPLVPQESKRAKLVVHAPDAESRVVVTNGDITLKSHEKFLEYVPTTEFVTSDDYEFIVNSGTDHVFYLPSLGNWVIGINKGGLSSTTSIDITGAGTYEVTVSYINSYIDVTYLDGAICTCSSGEVTLTAKDTTGHYRFTVTNLGDWVITSILDDMVVSRTVHVSYPEELITINMTEFNLNECSWEAIKSIVQSGSASSYWSIGDCKKITLDGTIDGITYTPEVDINAILIGFNHNTYIESSFNATVTFMIGRSNISDYDTSAGVETVIGPINSMNNSSPFYGGWSECSMRINRMPEFFDCLGGDLQDSILPVKKYSYNIDSSQMVETTDLVFLPSEYELFGNNSIADYDESSIQSQYSYFSLNTDKFIRYKYNATTTKASYWTRSSYGSSYFICVDIDGNADEKEMDNTEDAMFICPIFVIG